MSPCRGSPARLSPCRASPTRVSQRIVSSPVRVSPPRVSPHRIPPFRSTLFGASPRRTSPIRPDPLYSRTDISRSRSPIRSPVRNYVARSPVRVEFEERKVPVRDPPLYSYRSPRRLSPYRPATAYVRNASPLRGFEEDELAQSLKELIDLENKLESAKEALSFRPDFTLHDAFRIFDMSRFSRIGSVDIKEAYASFGVFITLDEALLIMSRFDRDRDETLTFAEFADMFLPFDALSGKSLNDRSYRFPQGYYITPDILDPITRSDFVLVLRLTMDVENHAERIRQKHAMRPLFDRTDAFEAINRFGGNIITKEDFANLLARNRFLATDKELTSLMDRFDKNKDGMVSYSEFVDEITPHSPVRY